jgi:hypothetical protein
MARRFSRLESFAAEKHLGWRSGSPLRSSALPKEHREVKEIGKGKASAVP